MPWIEKFRPTSLADIISNEDVIGTITKLIETNQLPNLLLYGPPGTGKTSTILACAKKLNGPRYSSMVLEVSLFSFVSEKKTTLTFKSVECV